MKTTGGVVGVITIAIIALVVGVISQTQTPTQPVTIEDGGTQTPQTTPDHRYEPTIHTKDAAELTPTQDIGSGWDTGVRHSTETATKQRPTPSSDKTAAESVPSTVHATNSHEHGEMVQVSDMWKSTTPLRTDESPSTKPQKEDEVHQTIRKFGNDVGTLVQTFVLTHSKQAERLGDFTMTRTDDGRTYVTSLADGYDKLATQIAAVQGPSTFSHELSDLADGYRAVADGLRVLKQSTDDTSTYQNMLTYNQQVEVFGKNFISFALLFKAQGVTFSEDEPGGIFTPPVAQQ